MASFVSCSYKIFCNLYLHFCSFVVGDKSILQDAGVTSMKDIETLEPPAECKDKVPYQRFTGDVSYFICTRVGSGPKVLTDETLALLDPITGLPK